ncbi:Stress response protein nst1 [Cyphellophora attinorum]|uniref:Stress response protein NST1 n=1 Tax=Cyphellophora attinorum TaxID=1664694 RepID=A0A0N1HG64_9EURO|nr:Stress response protein nst1 [Phialophora attinorum]KPI34327.1 Stress response protein nst1 [Phialophora attinorum]
MPPKAKKPRSQPNPATNSHLKEAATRLPLGSATATTPSDAPSLQYGQSQQHQSKPDVDSKAGDTTESADDRPNAPAVNRKKQKRRDKEAAKRAASQQLPNGHTPAGRGPPKGYFTEDADITGPPRPPPHDLDSIDASDDFFSGDDEDDADYGSHIATQTNSSWLNTSKRKKAKGRKTSANNSNQISRTSTAVTRPHVSTVSNAALRSAHRMSTDLWNPTTQNERDQIKEYWLQLGEDERRNLVRIEKEAVLKKMKEQQKHSCSCSVCGRKRTAIEEELEVLYDAYYEELEQFANPVPGETLPPPNSYPTRPRHQIPGAYSSSGRVQELDDDEEEELNSEEDFDSEFDPDDDLDYAALPPGPRDFFNFGNSLQVKDGILTVADDLLKNEGRNFIDMMESLAERRMQREEEIHFPSSALAHQGVHQGHNHAPLDDEPEYSDEDPDDDYNSQEDDEYDEDDPEEMEDSMTEEQRMEEGRRMFQIFAARMFEQRVLTAWKEKVSAERTQALINELDNDKELEAQREAKKARDAAKKKEKKKAQKAAKDEEKAAKRAAEDAAKEAEEKAEQKRLEEQRQRKEEQRKKREADRKAAEELRLKQEAEKLRRAQEQKDRQAEAERKAKEAKERERTKKEEAKRKEREEREAKEKEARERKAKEAQERKTREDAARREKETAAREAREKAGPPSSVKPQPVALPPGLTPPTRPGPMLQSPSVQAAIPVPPAKIPTPARVRQTSQPSQAVPSHGSSPKSQQGSSTEHSASPAGTLPQTPAQGQAVRNHGQPPVLHHPQPSAPRSPLNNPNRNNHAFNMNGLPGLGVSGPPNAPGMMPGMMPLGPAYGGPQGLPVGSLPRYGPNGMPFAQNYGGPRHFQPPQPMHYNPQQAPPTTMPSQQPVAAKPTHSRQTSGSGMTEASSHPAPIGRPGPIARPSSTTPDKQFRKTSAENDVEQITAQLGSKALLDDSDEALPILHDNRGGAPLKQAPGNGRVPFGSPFPEPRAEGFGHGFGGFGAASPWGQSLSQAAPRPTNTWSQQPFGGPLMPGAQLSHRSHMPRPVAVRLMLVEACRHLSMMGESLHPVQQVLQQVEIRRAPGEPSVSMDEMLEICDTEGNGQNGGGSFEVMVDQHRGQVIKFTEDNALPRSSVGDIGSPIPGHSNTAQPFPIGQQSSFGPPGRGF